MPSSTPHPALGKREKSKGGPKNSGRMCEHPAEEPQLLYKGLQWELMETVKNIKNTTWRKNKNLKPTQVRRILSLISEFLLQIFTWLLWITIFRKTVTRALNSSMRLHFLQCPSSRKIHEDFSCFPLNEVQLLWTKMKFLWNYPVSD